MELTYQKVIPRFFYKANYEDDVSPEIKKILLDQVGGLREGLYIYGGTGVGKTHLACAMIKNLLHAGFPVRFYNTSDFLEKLREEYSGGSSGDLELGLFRDVMDFDGILVFDDIGSEKVTEWAIERLYLVINKKYEDCTPVIFTSNCDMETLSARLGDRIASRIFGMTKIIRLEGTDKRLIKRS